ncbi:MAG: cyclic nucleotide-binding domain-containing protein [Phycisphaera sp.]|nr:cyclic nucleotide-binding domain-containing protein [Phycisphaera sp.]
MSTGPITIFQRTEDAVAYPAGSVVFKVGDPADCLFAVKTGSVDIVVHGKVVETIGENNIFGEMGLIDNTVRSADAIVKTDAQLVKVDRKRFIFLVQQHPFFSLQVMQLLADRLRKMNEKV